jgi:hypothetical protein
MRCIGYAALIYSFFVHCFQWYSWARKLGFGYLLIKKKVRAQAAASFRTYKPLINQRTAPNNNSKNKEPMRPCAEGAA